MWWDRQLLLKFVVGYVALGSDCFVLIGMREERKDKGARQAAHRMTNHCHTSQQETSRLWSASPWAGQREQRWDLKWCGQTLQHAMTAAQPEGSAT